MAVRTEEELWQRDASCRGPEAVLFFPPAAAETRAERDEREARAKSICSDCPVIDPCLDYAVRIREPHGIWGGLNEVERRAFSGQSIEG
ncbi:MAG: WhiB family transcriptional regulator [Acidimicrobiia bacterium]